jgi:hypothetical protein
MDMLLTLMVCSLLGGLLGHLMTRLSRKTGGALGVVLLVAYLTAALRLDLQSPAWRTVGAATIAFAMVTVVHLLRTEIVQELARRRGINEAEAAIRRAGQEQPSQ